MAEFTLIALKDEIVNDSDSLGYKNSATPTDWKSDQVVADLINDKLLKIDLDSVNMEVIRGSTDFDWYDSLSIDEQEWLRWQTPNSGLWQVSADMKLKLSGRVLASNGIAGDGDDADSFWATADRGDAAPVMLAIIEVFGSRAEVLWGAGITISLGQVGRAFNEI